MNLGMLKKDIKYLLKNPLFYLGVMIVSYIIISNVGQYADLYKNTGGNASEKYGDMGIVDGYIPTPQNEQTEQVIQRIYESLLEDYQVSPEEAENIRQDLVKLNGQKEIEKYLSGKYDMPGIGNLFEEYSGKKASRSEMEKYLKDLFKEEPYAESLSYKYIDFLGIGLIYFSIIVFLFIFMRDMKRDMYSMIHTKPISSSSYIFTKLFAGLIPLYMFAIVATGIFDILANRIAVQNGFACEWLSVWIKVLLFIFPNVFMIGSFFVFIMMVFKNILPTIPALLVYATYSNMGKALADGYRYIPNPLAIVVRFPNSLTKNYIPIWVIINQIVLISLAIFLLWLSIRLWEAKREVSSKYPGGRKPTPTPFCNRKLKNKRCMKLSRVSGVTYSHMGKQERRFFYALMSRSRGRRSLVSWGFAGAVLTGQGKYT